MVEKDYSRALAWFCEKGGRGVQQRLSDAFNARSDSKVRLTSGYLSEIKNGNRRLESEDDRRILVAVLSELFGEKNLTYEAFLAFGGLLAKSDAPPEQSLSRAKAAAVIDALADVDMRLRDAVKRSIEAGGAAPTDAFPVLGEAGPAPQSEPAPGFVPVKKAKLGLAAGTGQLVYESEDGFSGVHYYFRASWFAGRCKGGYKYAVLFDVRGDSMEPTIAEGGMVLVDTTPSDEWEENKIYALRVGDGIRIKRLRPHPSSQDNRVLVISDNKRIDEESKKREYPDEALDPEDIHIIGRVIWHSGEL